eukprot:3168139-Heterocapsa_arctica.AAC.1
MATNSLFAASGLGGLLDKDTGNHLYSWEEFAEKKLEKKPAGSGGDGLGQSPSCIDLEAAADDDGGGSEDDEDEEL